MITKFNRIPAVTLAVSALLGIGAAVGAANCAQAAQSDEVRVSYRDLDLSKTADVQTLYHRLERAASSVCGQVPAFELSRHQAYTRCYNAALDAAIAEVHSQELLALDRAARNARES
jgi:UrcA family protein